MALRGANGSVGRIDGSTVDPDPQVRGRIDLPIYPCGVSRGVKGEGVLFRMLITSLHPSLFQFSSYIICNFLYTKLSEQKVHPISHNKENKKQNKNKTNQQS